MPNLKVYGIRRFLQYEAENKGKGSLNGFSSIDWSLIENLGALIQAKAKNASDIRPTHNRN